MAPRLVMAVGTNRGDDFNAAGETGQNLPSSGIDPNLRDDEINPDPQELLVQTGGTEPQGGGLLSEGSIKGERRPWVLDEAVAADRDDSDVDPPDSMSSGVVLEPIIAS